MQVQGVTRDVTRNLVTERCLAKRPNRALGSDFAVYTCQAAHAVESPKPVFIRAACDGKISSAVLSSLREEIRNSQKYRLVSSLDDNGRMDVVQTIHMNCTERNEVAAVATNYGVAKCFSPDNCHASIDGISIKSTLCDASATADCGRTLFKAFDDYMSRPNPALLKLQ